MKNPIIDNRIVRDDTFALRLLNFAMSIKPGCAAGEEEQESMIFYATKLLQYQIETVTDQDEIDYLKRCDAKKKLKKAIKFLNH